MNIEIWRGFVLVNWTINGIIEYPQFAYGDERANVWYERGRKVVFQR
jgi:hypothetical protein